MPVRTIHVVAPPKIITCARGIGLDQWAVSNSGFASELSIRLDALRRRDMHGRLLTIVICLLWIKERYMYTHTSSPKQTQSLITLVEFKRCYIFSGYRLLIIHKKSRALWSTYPVCSICWDSTKQQQSIQWQYRHNVYWRPLPILLGHLCECAKSTWPI